MGTEATFNPKATLKKLEKMKEKHPLAYAGLVHTVFAAYAKKGKPAKVGEQTFDEAGLSDAAGFDPANLLALIEGLVKMAPAILAIVQAIIAMFG